jgi:hypothetical protein
MDHSKPSQTTTTTNIFIITTISKKTARPVASGVLSKVVAWQPLVDCCIFVSQGYFPHFHPLQSIIFVAATKYYIKFL